MDKQVLFSVGGKTIWHFPGASTFFFKSGLSVDADGAPNAYGPDGKGLDNLANAGHPGDWWALVTDNGRTDGKPVIQGSADPAPGFYVSTTALSGSGPPKTDPRKYVDATSVPYIVLPGHHHGQFPHNLKLGDFTIVVDGRSGRSAYAIYADVGPADQIGEGSVALAQALGVGSDPKRGNGCRDIVYVVLPGSGDGKPRSVAEIQLSGRSCFQGGGGFKRLALCFPEYAAHFPKS